MKSLKLTPEEQAIEDSLDDGLWKTVPDMPKRRKELQEAARAQRLKSERVNIRLNSMDLVGIKARAVREGLPYQTLIASLVHKFITGQLVSR